MKKAAGWIVLLVIVLIASFALAENPINETGIRVVNGQDEHGLIQSGLIARDEEEDADAVKDTEKVSITGSTEAWLDEVIRVQVSAPGATRIRMHYIISGTENGESYEDELVDEYETETIEDRMSFGGSAESIQYFATACFEDGWFKSETISFTLKEKGVIPEPVIVSYSETIETGDQIKVKINKIDHDAISQYIVTLHSEETGPTVERAVINAEDAGEVIEFTLDGENINKPGEWYINVRVEPRGIGYRTSTAVRKVTVTGDAAPAAPTFTLSDTECLMNESLVITCQEGFQRYEVRTRQFAPYQQVFIADINEGSNSRNLWIYGSGQILVSVRGFTGRIWTDWSENQEITGISYGKLNAATAIDKTEFTIGREDTAKVSGDDRAEMAMFRFYLNDGRTRMVRFMIQEDGTVYIPDWGFDFLQEEGTYTVEIILTAPGYQDSDPFEVNLLMHAAESQPKLDMPNIDPIDSALIHAPVELRWSEVENVQYYEVKAVHNDVEDWLTGPTQDTTLTFLPHEAGDWTVKVIACAEGYENSDPGMYTFSVEKQGTMEAPLVSDVEDVLVNQTVELQWQDMQDAEGYIVNLYRDGELFWMNIEVQEPSFVFSPEEVGQYTAEVTARKTGYTDGTASVSFEVSAVGTLTAPAFRAPSVLFLTEGDEYYENKVHSDLLLTDIPAPVYFFCVHSLKEDWNSQKYWGNVLEDGVEYPVSLQENESWASGDEVECWIEVYGEGYPTARSEAARMRLAKKSDFSTTMPDFVLPANLTVIESGAFKGIRANVIYIPESVEQIAADAFDSGVILAGVAGSAAQDYASENGYEFIAIGQ